MIQRKELYLVSLSDLDLSARQIVCESSKLGIDQQLLPSEVIPVELKQDVTLKVAALHWLAECLGCMAVSSNLKILSVEYDEKSERFLWVEVLRRLESPEPRNGHWRSHR